MEPATQCPLCACICARNRSRARPARRRHIPECSCRLMGGASQPASSGLLSKAWLRSRRFLPGRIWDHGDSDGSAETRRLTVGQVDAPITRVLTPSTAGQVRTLVTLRQSREPSGSIRGFSWRVSDFLRAAFHRSEPSLAASASRRRFDRGSIASAHRA